ncbi:unnamed protein product, partial [Musa textilis]
HASVQPKGGKRKRTGDARAFRATPGASQGGGAPTARGPRPAAPLRFASGPLPPRRRLSARSRRPP